MKNWKYYPDWICVGNLYIFSINKKNILLKSVGLQKKKIHYRVDTLPYKQQNAEKIWISRIQKHADTLRIENYR